MLTKFGETTKPIGKSVKITTSKINLKKINYLSISSLPGLSLKVLTLAFMKAWNNFPKI